MTTVVLPTILTDNTLKQNWTIGPLEMPVYLWVIFLLVLVVVYKMMFHAGSTVNNYLPAMLQPTAKAPGSGYYY